MNITKRILSTLLAVVTLLSTFTAVFTFQVSAADATTSTPAEITPVKDYVTKVYNNPQEKLQTMEMMREEGNYQLWVFCVIKFFKTAVLSCYIKYHFACFFVDFTAHRKRL